MTARFRAEDLTAFGADLFAAAGMPEDRAGIVSGLLVEADLMGHDTHGLAQAGAYLAALENGGMARTGDPQVVSDRGATVLWDGGYLSGVWLTAEAIRIAVERAEQYGTVTISIRRSHHIACLAAFLPLATRHGFMITLASSDPSVAGVAPHGAYQAIFTPDPIAIGIPTDGDPVLIDISASATTIGMSQRAASSGERLPGPWLIDNQGHATDDPAVLNDDPPGALLPLGGLERGHKGFGLALMIEALTAGLGGYGRADGAGNWGAAVYLQVIDPSAFGGRAAFTRETSWLARACRAASVPPGQPAVRLPGDAALTRRRQALADGVALYPAIMTGLAPWAEKLGVPVPTALAD